MKPRLTDKVIRGLIHMAAVCEAGGPDEVFGAHRPEEMKQWDDVKAAILWSFRIRDYRAARALAAQKKEG